MHRTRLVEVEDWMGWRVATHYVIDQCYTCGLILKAIIPMLPEKPEQN